MNSSNNKIVDEVNAIIDEFGFFDDWEDKYAYLIDMGKKLEPMDEELKVEETKLRGCQSTVYFYSEKSNEGLVNFSDVALTGATSAALSGYETASRNFYIFSRPDTIFDAFSGFQEGDSPDFSGYECASVGNCFLQNYYFQFL